MQSLQVSYLRAVAAAAGCSVSGFDIDEGDDGALTHRSQAHGNPDKQAKLSIQLKSTSKLPAAGASVISAKMSGTRFNEYAIANPTFHKIVIVMGVPQDQAHWVFARAKGLSIHHAAYWVNLAGMPTVSTLQTIVSAPLTQIFNDVALCDIMERIGQGGAP